ncbi:MAG: hypothetical protein F6J96_25180 [Symploca sp. SIO1C2]|nr:hypothetical protein [Symploca sp. SIO1C2]NER49876.1 hypothetical protein [Symploca sp. SIO1A3]
MIVAERIESLKAGILAALSFTLAYSITAVAHRWVLAKQFELFAFLQITNEVDWLLKLAVACLSGFLFGVTYRYIIRQDDNSHLKGGAVLAFGLVRGLTPVEVQPNLTEAYWLLGILAIESILDFAIARFTLDWAIHFQWLKTFNSQ